MRRRNPSRVASDTSVGFAEGGEEQLVQLNGGAGQACGRAALGSAQRFFNLGLRPLQQLACSRELSAPDFGTGCGSSIVVPTTATGVCLFVLSRDVGMQLMQLVEAALAEQLDPAPESCAAVSSGLSGVRGAGVATGGKASKPALAPPHRDLRAQRGSRRERSREYLAHTFDEEPRHILEGGNGVAKLGRECGE
ncbi:unnamed protein product [Symbiodinium sp. KB8]|nr:unnamed protein product [Symbiodinium sp. KB8]